MEEFIMTARGLRNNNPGNIRINGDLFQGEVRPSKDKSFKQFTTMAYGYRAMFKILSNYFKNYKLDTIRKMIIRWAPQKENHTEAYIKAVSDYAGIPSILHPAHTCHNTDHLLTVVHIDWIISRNSGIV